MAYQSIYSGSNATKVPNSSKDNPFLADFTPGQYARKNQPATKVSQPKQQPKPAPQPQYKSLFSKITNTAKTVGKTAESAGKAIMRPTVDLATGKGGKAVHDTAQLSADISGNTVNQFAKGVKYTPAMVAADVTGNAKAQASTQKKAFGTTKSGDIAKKIAGSTVGTASMFLGGGEVAGAKSLLSGGIKKLAPKIIKDANIGGAGNLGVTLTNHPEASQKELGKSLGIGMVGGGLFPVAGKVIGKGVSGAVDKAGIGATRDLVRNTQTKSLLDRSRAPTTVATPIDTATTKSLNTIMSKIRTPSKVIAEQKAQGEAQVTAQKETAKATETNQKLDDKIELIKAKKADGKFTNVDKVKVKQLEGQKVPVEGQAKPTIPGAKTPFDTPEIIKMRQEQEKIASTHTDMSPERVALREKVGQMLYQQGGHADAAKAIPIKSERHADIVLGPPASGKTNIVNPLLQKHGARLIDSDEAKSMLGDVNQAGALHQESDAITTDQLVRAAKRGDNIVLPLVGKSADRVKAAMAALKDQGYDVHLHYNHLAPEKTAQRAVSRFEETGRFVDPHYVYNEVGLKPKATYDMLKNNEHVSSYKAYDNDVAKGEQPKLTEEGKNSGLRQQPDTAGRPLRGHGTQETPKPAQTKSLKVSNSTKRKEYNPSKAEPVSVPIEQAKPAERSTQAARTSGSALNLEARAVQKGLAKEFEGKAEYGAGSYKDEAAAAVKLVKENPDEAKAIAYGQKPGDNTIHEVAVAKALENKALKEGDVNTLLKLSQSPRHSVTSEAAQRLGAEGYGESGSVVKHLAAIAKVRKDAVEKKLGKPIAKAVSDTVKQIKAAKPVLKKQEWGDFVESLKC